MLRGAGDGVTQIISIRRALGTRRCIKRNARYNVALQYVAGSSIHSSQMHRGKTNSRREAGFMYIGEACDIMAAAAVSVEVTKRRTEMKASVIIDSEAGNTHRAKPAHQGIGAPKIAARRVIRVRRRHVRWREIKEEALEANYRQSRRLVK